MQRKDDWFKDFFYKYYSGFCRVAYGYVNDRDTSEDIVQECFTQFWEQYETREIVNPPAYVLTMVRNRCITSIRRSNKLEALQENAEVAADHSGLPFEQEHKPDAEEMVTEVLSLLPEKCRLIFKMSRIQKKTYRQIADELQLSIKTIENQMGKSIKVMRQYVSDHPEYFIRSVVFFFLNI